MIILLVLLLYVQLQANAVEWFVNKDAQGSTQDGTQSNPCLTVSCALALTSLADGDIILILPGEYTGVSNSDLASLKKAISIQGDGDPITIIMRSTAVNSRFITSKENSITLLQNLTVQGFQTLSDTSSYLGGGILVTDNSTIMMRNMIFTNNSAAQGGAISVLEGSMLSLENCVFSENMALSGGGAISIDSSSLNVSGSSFLGNIAQGNPDVQAFGDGGAILFRGNTQNAFHIKESVFANNSAAEAGGAIFVQSLNTLPASFSVYNTHFNYNYVTGLGRCTASTLCNIRGGAIYSSVPSSRLYESHFLGNRALTNAANQFGEGGAIFSTSVFDDDKQGLTTIIQSSSFVQNYASGCGGAAYLLNQLILVQQTQFTQNVAGIKDSLFSDTSSTGGALWYSAPYTYESSIHGTNFTDNYVWGGWGGAIFCTDSPHPLHIDSCHFTNNKAFSSYTFVAQGGAVMISHNSVALVSGSTFANNTVSPRADIGAAKGPYTLSGSGGAIYIHSANITVTSCNFKQNFALTGQFDSGSSGGAMLIEDSPYSVVENSDFYDNGAVGYLGYSSYASSGSAGALVTKFSSAIITNCKFIDNWVSVGGTQLSAGGAIAVYFDYTSSTEDDASTGVQIVNSLFSNNAAFGQLCTSGGPKAGQGGAIAIVGASIPGVTMTGVNFSNNAAVSRTGFVLSYGGAMSISVASNVSCTNCHFKNNMALYGIGNDLSALSSENGQTSQLTFKNSRFSAANYSQVGKTRTLAASKEKVLCAIITRLMAHITPSGDFESQSHERSLMSDSTPRTLPPWLSDLHNEELRLEAESMNSKVSPDSFNEANEPLYRRRDLSQVRNELKVPSVGALANTLTLQASNKADDIQAFYHYPSMLVTSGSASLINPIFEGNYHVFLGDLLSLLLTSLTNPQSSASASTASCTASIYGEIQQTSLTLTVFHSTLTLASFYQKTLDLRKLTLINGTMHVANNITISGNSSLISSAISGQIDITQFSGTVPSEFLKANRRAILRFNGDLFTGFNLADIKILQSINAFAAAVLLDLEPIIVINSCNVQVFKAMEISTPQRVKESSKSAPLYIYMQNNAAINVTAAATIYVKTTTFIVANTSVSPAVTNMGTIVLDGATEKGVDDVVDDDSTGTHTDIDDFDDDRTHKKKKSQASSLDNTLTVFGIFSQTPSGKIIVTLNSTGQTKPVLNLVNNETFLGTIAVNFLDSPSITLYNGAPSSWALVSYSTASKPSARNHPAQLSAPQGLGFYRKSSVSANASGKTSAWTDTYVIDAMSCSDALSYSAGIEENSNNLYPCYVCLSNSSCSFCNSGQCMDSSSQCAGNSGGVQYKYSCCTDNCNTPNGRCEALSANTEFQCVCTPFYTGDTCRNLSNISIVLITLAGALVVVIGILFYSYRSTLGKKTQVLEELRQGLLYDQQHLDHRSSTTAINEAYIQSLQQGLILKDVSVKWKEIEIEKQVGEGSFGVVYKATFRGASVAVKKMRPLFSELSARDVEEFNKEAYMMSRLRHPNIVLVMGISFVDQEIIPMPRRSSIADQREGFGGDDDTNNGNPSDKKVLPKTVCIVTEFLEQGSLADILYGPHRLPAEVWTYDLIITCALQAARGMLYLHTHSPPICHRDLKSSNLVVDDHWVVKVTDFGMSRILPEKIRDMETGKVLEGAPTVLSTGGDRHGDPEGRESFVSAYSVNSGHSINSIRNLDGSVRSQGHGATAGPEMTSNLGTTAWCAPELFTSSSTTRYSVKVDVYSFGMVLWELWEKKRPYEELQSRFDIMDAVRSGKRPAISDNCPPAYKSLTQRCWQAEPGRRPNFQYIVRYLKDELARVKRQRERQLSTSIADAPYNYFGAGGIYGNSSNISTGDATTNIGSKFSQLLPWNRMGKGITAERPTSNDYYGQPQPVPTSRASLAAVNDRNLAYLAASPAITSPILMQQQQQGNYFQPPPSSPRNAGQSTGVAIPSPRAAAGPPNQWRDKYVMKFNGWRASQPDTGLPPSAMTTASNAGVSTSSLLPFFVPNSFAQSPVNPTSRLSNNAVILEDQNGIFNLDQDNIASQSGSYTPPVITGDTIAVGGGGSSPIIRVSNSGSGSGRWSRDPDQQSSQTPQPREQRNSKSSSF